MALDVESLHEFWRMQLLDELRRRRAALEYEPSLDRQGLRRAAFAELIARLEDEEIEALHELASSSAARCISDGRVDEAVDLVRETRSEGEGIPQTSSAAAPMA